MSEKIKCSLHGGYSCECHKITNNPFEFKGGKVEVSLEIDDSDFASGFFPKGMYVDPAHRPQTPASRVQDMTIESRTKTNIKLNTICKDCGKTLFPDIKVNEDAVNIYAIVEPCVCKFARKTHVTCYWCKTVLSPKFDMVGSQQNVRIRGCGCKIKVVNATEVYQAEDFDDVDKILSELDVATAKLKQKFYEALNEKQRPVSLADGIIIHAKKKSELDKAFERNHRLQGRIDELEKGLIFQGEQTIQANQTRDALKGRNDKLDKEVRLQKGIILKQKQVNDELKKENDIFETAVSKNFMAYAPFKDKIKNLEDEIDKKEKFINKIHSSTSLSENIKLRKEIEDLKLDKSTLKGTISRMEGGMKDVQYLLVERDEHIKELNLDKVKLKLDVGKYRMAAEANGTELLKVELDVEQFKYAAQINGTQLIQLTKEYDELKAGKIKERNETKHYINELEEKVEEIAGLKTMVLEFEATNKKLNERMKTMKSKTCSGECIDLCHC